jgi:hypothetical protein
MSRHSPTGFAFGILFEIAAVVAIVSFLPRIDLRPPTASATGQAFAQVDFGQTGAPESAISPVGWTQIDRSSPDFNQQASYYQRPTAQPAKNSPQDGSLPPQAAPPLIESDPARTQYVEQRLDRASQQLVNSVGSAVTQAATNWRRYPPTAEQPSAVAPPAPTASRRQRTGSASSPPRPWIRY